jgi:putative ABC transport system substrate-binding protein
VRAAPAPESTLSALRRGLAEHGYLEGQHYVLVPSWGDGAVDRLPALASALVRSKVDIIVTDGTETARAARQATATIPIVMAGGRDPVAGGLAASLSHPGGNVTGFTTQVIELTGKTFEILSEIYPGLRRIAVINPIGAGILFRSAEAEAAQALKLELRYVVFRDLQAAGIDTAIREAAALGSQAAVVRGTPFLSTSQRRLVVEAAAAHRLPTIYETREFVELGGLVSYGTDFSNLFRLAAGYVVRILNGTTPADLPIQQATKFELVINLKTAKAIGLEVPPTLLARADEVIE